MDSDSSSTSLSLVLFYFLICFITIFLTIYVLHKLWNEKFPPLIPVSPYNFTLNSDQPNQHKITGLKDLYSIFFRLLVFFKDDYWMRYCGFDALSYLNYQRKMIKFLFIWLILLGK